MKTLRQVEGFTLENETLKNENIELKGELKLLRDRIRSKKKRLTPLDPVRLAKLEEETRAFMEIRRRKPNPSDKPPST